MAVIDVSESALAGELEAIVGADMFASTPEPARRSRATRRHSTALPDAVVFPAATDEVAAVLRLATRRAYRSLHAAPAPT